MPELSKQTQQEERHLTSNNRKFRISGGSNNREFTVHHLRFRDHFRLHWKHGEFCGRWRKRNFMADRKTKDQSNTSTRIRVKLIRVLILHDLNDDG